MSSMTPTEFAATVNSDGKTVRKFLRAITPKEDQPGKGSRWALPAGKREVAKLTKQFNEWSAKQAEERAARAQEKAEAAQAEVVEEEELDD